MQVHQTVRTTIHYQVVVQLKYKVTFNASMHPRCAFSAGHCALIVLMPLRLTRILGTFVSSIRSQPYHKVASISRTLLNCISDAWSRLRHIQNITLCPNCTIQPLQFGFNQSHCIQRSALYNNLKTKEVMCIFPHN